MPAALQMLAQVFPMQHYLVIMRSVVFKGAGLARVLPPVLARIVLGVGSSAVALVSLRNRLD